MCLLKPKPHSSVSRKGLRRDNCARIGKVDCPQGRFSSLCGIKIISKSAVVRVEEVVDQSVNLDVICYVIRGMKVDLGVTSKWLIQIGFISKKHLVACSDKIGANLPFGCEPVIETRFKAGSRYAAKCVAWTYVDAALCRIACARYDIRRWVV